MLNLNAQLSSMLVGVMLVSAQILPESFAEFDISDASGGVGGGADINRCKRPGDRYVYNYIQYECFTTESDTAVDGSPNNRLNGKPIGCVPTNATTGPVILPGATFTSEHFRYECNRGRTNAISLRITHCIDNNGELVKIGDFFSEVVNVTSGEGDPSFTTTASVECVGDAFLAKKIVHNWSKCRLENGETIIEGNFVTRDVNASTLRSSLQKSEILSCLREDGRVSLKCTGCVATSGDHVAVSKYLHLDGGQWTQCRRVKDGCRLLNVSSDYIDCEYEGRKFAHGSSFKSESGLSTFHCNYGVVAKKGCLINGNLVLVGDVRYIDDRPLLCSQSDQLVQFDGIVGCDLPSGKFKRFLEVWRDDHVMKRCSWTSPTIADAGVAESRVISFACIDGKDIVPLNKIVRRLNGDYYKCAPPLSIVSDTLRDDFVEGDVPLEMRILTAEELTEFLKRKNSRLDLFEYFGVGAQSHPNELENPERSRPPAETCEDMLPFCNRLSNYCNSVENSDFAEPGLAIDQGRSDADDVEANFEKLAAAPKRTSKSECDNQLTPFQKLQTLVQISCAKTCRKCSRIIGGQKERLISNLERTSHCGRSMVSNTNNTTEDDAFYEGKIVNKRWVVDNRLGEGCCGIVFKVHDIKDPKRKAAMKVELREENVEVLKNEVRVLRQLLDRSHVVQLIDCGKRRSYSYLVMTLFGRNLLELKRSSSLDHFTHGCVTRIGIQTLYAVKQVHEIGYVHRDIKPQNLVVGRRGHEARMIFLIDYGLARSFVVWTNNTHRLRKPRQRALLRGTTRYCSPDVHERKEQGRKDDLWSLLYLMVELTVGLPWVKKQELETKAMKLKTSDETLLKNCPKEWMQFLKHIRTLTYESRPDYKFLYDTLMSTLNRLEVSFADPYDWEKPADLGKQPSSDKLSKTCRQPSLDIKRSSDARKDQTKSVDTGSCNTGSDSSAAQTLYPNTAPAAFSKNDLRL